MKIEGIKKVTLSVKWGGSPDEMKTFSETHSVEFIYGIGTVGLSPFEVSLSGKDVGDKLSLRIKRSELADYFMHLVQSLHGIPQNMAEIYFNMKIIDVSEAGQKEVIKAMAEMAVCGDHCCGGY